MSKAKLWYSHKWYGCPQTILKDQLKLCNVAYWGYHASFSTKQNSMWWFKIVSHLFSSREAILGTTGGSPIFSDQLAPNGWCQHHITWVLYFPENVLAPTLVLGVHFNENHPIWKRTQTCDQQANTLAYQLPLTALTWKYSSTNFITPGSIPWLSPSHET